MPTSRALPSQLRLLPTKHRIHTNRQKQSAQGDSRILRWALKSKTLRWQTEATLPVPQRMLATEHPSSLTPKRVQATGGQARRTPSRTSPPGFRGSAQTPQQVGTKSFRLDAWLLKAPWQPENPNLNTPHNICQWSTLYDPNPCTRLISQWIIVSSPPERHSSNTLHS